MVFKSIWTSYTCTMAIRVVEFSNGGCKIRKILPKNQHTQRIFLNFENWTNGGPKKLAKIRVGYFDFSC